MLSIRLLTSPALFTTAALASPLQTLEKRNVGGVRLCDQINWQGDCWYGILPINTCISLNSFAGKTLSFRPDDATECFLMQDRCDVSNSYADFTSASSGTNDLSVLPWIGKTESFICFTEATTAREKIRVLERIRVRIGVPA
ncbi:hypothetical protein B0A48_09923 [Cryoendolithus antarcticus]|uniref:LysM domain-containing protein n=1 Tax=Cryoendolithus antarcticus TaxID=1507870 RepID=A0A1V8T3N2_9PEZI|nr:hypothetical protein B0A48_09923 [Cryoendolithus antarcticus]